MPRLKLLAAELLGIFIRKEKTLLVSLLANPEAELRGMRSQCVFKPYSCTQTKLIPLSLPEQLQFGTFEYALNYIVDNHIDFHVFHDRFKNDATGAPAFKAVKKNCNLQ